MSRGSYVWRGFCPRGFCLRGFSPEGVLSASRTWHMFMICSHIHNVAMCVKIDVLES